MNVYQLLRVVKMVFSFVSRHLVKQKHNVLLSLQMERYRIK